MVRNTRDPRVSRAYKQQRLVVLARDNYVCVYCGADATQVDHIIPRSKGGTHDMENLLACCAKCNGLKAVFLDVVAQ